jgi:hypothetical protein
MKRPRPGGSLVPKIPDNLAVKVIGLGGTGGIVARYGAMFLAAADPAKSVRMVLIDGDVFENSNATRMFFSRCGNKAAVTRDDLLERFRDSPLSLTAVEEYVTPENITRLIHPGNLVILTVDNHASRKLVGEYCATLDDICLISSGNDGVGADSTGTVQRGTFGNCQMCLRAGGHDVTPPLLKYHPELRNPADRLPTDRSCTELMASVPQVLFANLLSAAACLNAMWLYLCGVPGAAEVCFDIAEQRMAPMSL